MLYSAAPHTISSQPPKKRISSCCVQNVHAIRIIMDGRTSGVKYYQEFDFGDCGTSFSEIKSATCNMREISGSTDGM